MQEAYDTVWKYLIAEDTRVPKFQKALLDLSQHFLEESLERQIHFDLLTTAFDLGRDDLFKTCIQVFQDTNPQESFFPTISYILTLGLSKNCVIYLGNLYELVYFEVLEGLLSTVDDGYLSSAFIAIDYIFSDSRGSTIQEADINSLLIVLADYETNDKMQQYLQSKRLELSTEPADVPSWIIPGDPISKMSQEMLLASLPELLEPSTYISKSPEADVEYLLNHGYVNPRQTAEDTEIFRNNLTNQFIKKSPANRTAAVRWIQDNTKNMLQIEDAKIFGILGPCLMQSGAIDLSNDSKDICRRYGGCRWMTCYENENVEEVTGDALIDDIVKNSRFAEVDWWTGKCQICAKVIRYKHYGARKAEPTGGFSGCYCSFECIQDSLDKTDVVSITLNNHFWTLVNDVGIYDRTW